MNRRQLFKSMAATVTALAVPFVGKSRAELPTISLGGPALNDMRSYVGRIELTRDTSGRIVCVKAG